MPLSPGDRLGSHEIIGLLGAGGMGEVYRAQDTRLNREVAIKVLPATHEGDPERIARFQREAQAVAALNHPNIAGIFEFADSGDVKFLVLELIDGDTLAERIRRGSMSVEEALAIAKQILEALEAAHERGICHRDLKPANVKLAPSRGGSSDPPTVKVLDFGLAKFLQSGPIAPNLTHSPTLSLAGTFPGVILGTAGYMSPEQAKGFEADQRSDIFSFGCVFYELLTGRQAFEGETASEILASVLKTEPDFSALPARLNPRIVEILRRCLEKNPKKRWHAAADVRVELEGLMGHPIVTDEPRVIIEAVRRPLWRRAVSVTAGIVVGALAAGYAAWTLKPAPHEVTRFTLTLPEGQSFSNMARQVVALSPDGTTLVYAASQRLFLRAMSSLDAREIAGSSGLVQAVVFSPDGLSVAYWTAVDNRLKRLSINGGAAVTVCAATPVSGMSWDEGGIVFGQAGKGIVRVAAAGGVPEVIAPVDSTEMASMPQLLPGGKAVLFSVKKASDEWDNGRVVVQPLGGERKNLIEGGAAGRYLPTGHLAYAQSGVLLAVPFDIRTLTVVGGPVPILEGVLRTNSDANGTGIAHFSYSRTGSLVYLPGPVSSATTVNDLVLFDRKGASQPLKLPQGFYRSPRVSPDGKWVTFDSEDSGGATVWVYNLSGGTSIRRLTFGGKNRAPIWSADSRWVAFQSDREGDLAIFRQRSDGSGAAERLTKPEPGTSHMPQAWSPNGEYLLYHAGSDKGFTLWTMAVKDRRISQFGGVQSEGQIEAVFSPDGRWIAYRIGGASAGAPRSVYLQPFPTTGATYQVPQQGGSPYWTSKNELILNVGPGISLAIPVSTTPRVEFGTPVDFPRAGRNEGATGTTRRNADAMPDGEHFVGVSGVGGNAVTAPITIVLNWFDEVKQRVPRN